MSSSIEIIEPKIKEAQDEVTINQEDEGSEEPKDSPDLSKTIDELKTKIETMTKEVRELKNKQPEIDSDDSDLNDSVMQSGNKKSYNIYLKKQAFLKVMDELDELAEHFSSIDNRITKRIDNIADRLRFYDKG